MKPEGVVIKTHKIIILINSKYTWALQTVNNTPVMNILKGYFYLILF